jgi:hypothetical protein
MAVGGSIESLALNGRNFSVPADADANLKLGGFENEVQPNGDGTGRLIKTRVPLSVEGLTVSVDDFLGDLEFLQNLANLKGFFPGYVTLASGAVWQGDLQIVGELPKSTQSATAPISLSGTGTLTRQ